MVWRFFKRRGGRGEAAALQRRKFHQLWQIYISDLFYGPYQPSPQILWHRKPLKTFKFGELCVVVWCVWCARYLYRLVLKPCRCSASVLVLRCVLCCLVDWFTVQQFQLPHPSAILWHRFKVCAGFKESCIQQPRPPSTGQRAPPAHRNAKAIGCHKLKGRQRRACASTRASHPQNTAEQQPNPRHLTPSLSPPGLHHHAPASTRFSCMQGSCWWERQPALNPCCLVRQMWSWSWPRQSVRCSGV